MKIIKYNIYNYINNNETTKSTETVPINPANYAPEYNLNDLFYVQNNTLYTTLPIASIQELSSQVENTSAKVNSITTNLAGITSESTVADIADAIARINEEEVVEPDIDSSTNN